MTDRTGKLIDRYRRILRFANLSVYWNVFLAIGKLFFGLLTYSFFLCVNAFYNAGMGIAKYLAVFAYKKYDFRPGDRAYRLGRRKQNVFYRRIGMLLIAASALYIVYCVRMFLGAQNTQYGPLVAIGIAAFTFVEIFISLHGAVATRRDREPMMEAIKLINLASSMISLVLTQAALLSFTRGGNAVFFNGLSGILFGSVAAGIGVYMLIHMYRITHGQTERSWRKRIGRMLSVVVPDAGIDLIGFEDIEAHTPRMRCRYANFDPARFACAVRETDRRYGIELVYAEPFEQNYFHRAIASVSEPKEATGD